NRTARRVLNSVFAVCDSHWRGLGLIKNSGLKLKPAYQQFSGERKFKLSIRPVPDPKGCICGEVLQGIKKPGDCRLFKKRCTPQKPIGPCMVSSEGTCAAYYKYR
ncbi:MAG: hydrogenase formation protein HypD, partial [Candidatus Omnitrophica bacterium]|nr:hydrogenase formation protein HypD [Candidatus Omnitrophota bacterium]